MGKISILDCTLRDGAYIVNGKFEGAKISGIIDKLQNSNIDLIECGWLKDNDYTDGSSYYHVPQDMKAYVKHKKENATFIAMIDYNRYNCDNLPDRKGEILDAIRVVFPVGKVEEGLEAAQKIRKKGYDVYLQLANTLGYTDAELIEVAQRINEFKPKTVSIVDTFGTMYPWDLERLIIILDNNLSKDIALGFHSHNNQQLSFALAIQFIEKCLFLSDRDIVVDCSLCGMGRGAGNACTELLANYINKKFSSSYNMDEIMNCIDLYMVELMSEYDWGYTIPYALAGIYGCHVNNVSYLLDTHRTQYKDMRMIFEKMDASKRIQYDYDNLEKVYYECVYSNINDDDTSKWLSDRFNGKEVLLILPGQSVDIYKERIKEFIRQQDVITVGINSWLDGFEYDLVFFTNVLKYEYAMNNKKNGFYNTEKLITSNIKSEPDENEWIINIKDQLTRPGKYHDNSAIIFLWILSQYKSKKVYVAGFDGYKNKDIIYAKSALAPNVSDEKEYRIIHQELEDMIKDLVTNSDIDLKFITPSPFEKYERK